MGYIQWTIRRFDLETLELKKWNPIILFTNWKYAEKWIFSMWVYGISLNFILIDQVAKNLINKIVLIMFLILKNKLCIKVKHHLK